MWVQVIFWIVVTAVLVFSLWAIWNGIWELLRSRRKRPETQEAELVEEHTMDWWWMMHQHYHIGKRFGPVESCPHCPSPPSSPPSSQATEITAETPPGNGAG